MKCAFLIMTCSVLRQHTIPKEFWADAIDTAAYIKNWLTCTGLSFTETPHVVEHSERPNVTHLWVSWSKCWYHNQKEISSTLGDKSQVAAFISYCPDRKAFKICDTTEQKVVVSRDVFFVGNKSGFADFENDSLSNMNASVRNRDSSQRETELLPLSKAQSHVSKHQVPPNLPDEQCVNTVDNSEHETEQGADTPGTSKSSDILPTVRRSARSRTFSLKWRKGPSAFITNIPDEK